MDLPKFAAASGARVQLGLLQPFLETAVLVGALAYLYAPVLVDLAFQWRNDENSSHGFLIPLVSGYLVWERRAQLRRSATTGSAWGYPVLVFGLLLLVVGQAATFGYPARLSLLVVLTGLLLFLSGPRVLRILAFPLAYLLFMIPLPALALDRIAFPLQLLAAKAATGMLDLLNIPVLREGNVISLASVQLEVAEACSGIRSLVSLLALAAIYAYLTQRSRALRLGIFLSAIPIALVANASRVTLTGVLVQLFGPGVALGFYHAFSGLLVFILAFALLAVESLAISQVVAMRARS